MRRCPGACYGLSILIVSTICLFATSNENQNPGTERTYPQSKAAIEKVLKTLQSSVSGRLPLVEGFVLPGERSLDRYQRAYYQCSIQILPVASGGSKVRVAAKITAWYADASPSRSGYQALPSNGRLETDLLDQIAEALAGGDAKVPPSPKVLPEPGISAPMPRIPEGKLHAPAPIHSGGEVAGSLKTQTDAAEKHEQELATEAKGLEEILQNQAHPANLVAVKKSGTPILQAPNADAQPLFPATAGDEFEVLDMNSNWVHVRISGLSRGWIRRSALELPEDLSGKKPQGPSSEAAEEFRISNEQLAPFPGDWEPLRGKIVKIVTVQKAIDSAKNYAPGMKLQFAKKLLLKQYAEIAATGHAPAGIVLIFDSEDGGMLAATEETLTEWQAGTATDEAIWRQCFFDPPELSGLGH